jgi:hypothetical protein
MPVITMKDRHLLPDNAKPTAARIEQLGFKWKYDSDYPVPDPDKAQRLQIRDEQHIAPTADINRYALAMKRGDKFPPGVVTEDGYCVDYNTRAAAAHKLGWPTFHAFIVDVRYATATGFQRDSLMLLGAAFNSGHGKGLTRAEQIKIIRQVQAGGNYDAGRVEAYLNLSKNMASNVYAQVRAEDRAQRLGIPFNGSVTASNRAMLAQRVEKLSDQPWKEIARLAQDSGMTGEDLSDLCNRVNAETSGDAARLAIIATERDARDAQIRRFTATGKKRPPASSNLRKRLGFILDYQERVGDLVDYNPTTAKDYLEQVATAAAVLRRLERAQSEATAQLAFDSETAVK